MNFSPLNKKWKWRRGASYSLTVSKGMIVRGKTLVIMRASTTTSADAACAHIKGLKTCPWPGHHDGHRPRTFYPVIRWLWWKSTPTSTMDEVVDMAVSSEGASTTPVLVAAGAHTMVMTLEGQCACSQDTTKNDVTLRELSLPRTAVAKPCVILFQVGCCFQAEKQHSPQQWWQQQTHLAPSLASTAIFVPGMCRGTDSCSHNFRVSVLKHFCLTLCCCSTKANHHLFVWRLLLLIDETVPSSIHTATAGATCDSPWLLSRTKQCRDADQ